MSHFMHDKIEYHSDYGPERHPAIDVRYRGGVTYVENVPDDVAEQAWNAVAEVWWDAATQLAHEYGYSGVFQEGRSGGWLVPYYQGYPPRRQLHWHGQGSTEPGSLAQGYPRFPDMLEFGERSRFLGFQRRIRDLLEEVEANLELEIAAILSSREGPDPALGVRQAVDQAATDVRAAVGCRPGELP